MSRRNGKKNAEDVRKKRYLFKVTIVGPDDAILERVLSVVNDAAVSVDGIRIGTTAVETDESDVRAVTWSPQHTALDMLLSVTFAGANAVVIVMPDIDPAIESIYRNEIRQNLGSGVPTRMIVVGSEIDDFKRVEIISTFEDLFHEILERKEKSESK
jgi:hypothetical protein